jgi:hypothetical protein
MIISIEVQIAAVTLEISRRKKTYPSLIASGEMNSNQAEMLIVMMESVLATLCEFKDEHGGELRRENLELKRQLNGK